MRKIWTPTVDGRPHEVDVTWDVSATGCGRIAVDGIELRRWILGAKYPGKTLGFEVAGRPAFVRQGVLDFELNVDGRGVPGARPAHWSRPAEAIAATAGLAIAVVVVVGLGMLIAAQIAGGL